MSQVFTASRLTAGNLLFPKTISVQADGILFEKRGLFGSSEETINYRQVASVKLRSGILFSTIVIETAGGSQPVTLNGLWKGDGKVVKDLIQKMQAPT